MNCPCPCNFLSWALLKLMSITLSTTSRSPTRQFVSISLWAFLSLQEFTHHLSEKPTIFQRNPPFFRGTQHLSEEPNTFQRNPPSFRETHHLSVPLALNQKKTSFQLSLEELGENPTGLHFGCESAFFFVADWTFSYSCVQARARTSQCMVSCLR